MYKQKDSTKKMTSKKRSRWDVTDSCVKRPSWDDTFMEFLKVLAKRSICCKYKTSSLVVKDTQILSMGYNGTFAKQEECETYWRKQYEEFKSICECYNLSFDQWMSLESTRIAHRIWSASNEIHAEVNALNWISKGDINEKYILYTLYSPCDACAKEIISYGIKNVKYKYLYLNGVNALTRLKQNGVCCVQIE